VSAFSVLSIHPPGKIEQQLLENAFEKPGVFSIEHFLLYVIDPPGGPRMNGRVYVPECPFVSRYLPVRVHVPFPREERKLTLSEFRVYHSKRDSMKREVPCREPGIFPLVGHREYV